MGISNYHVIKLFYGVRYKKETIKSAKTFSYLCWGSPSSKTVMQYSELLENVYIATSSTNRQRTKNKHLSSIPHPSGSRCNYGPNLTATASNHFGKPTPNYSLCRFHTVKPSSTYHNPSLTMLSDMFPWQRWLPASTKFSSSSFSTVKQFRVHRRLKGYQTKQKKVKNGMRERTSPLKIVPSF